MISWFTHKLWLGLLALALVLGLFSEPVLGMAQKDAAHKRAALHQQNAEAEQALQQLQEDIAAAETMKEEIDGNTAKKFLAPVDRLRVAQILEHRAAEAHLSRFTYTLSPEQKTTIDTAGAGKQELALSQITLSADAPTDVSVYAFLDAVMRTLPGRFTVRHITLQRDDKSDAPIKAANLHFEANGEWLSNGARPPLPEAKP